MTTNTCKQCGKPYQIQSSRANKSSYCSRPCMASAYAVIQRVEPVRFTCRQCAAEFSVKPCRAPKAKFCSKSCKMRHQHANRPRISFEEPCAHCGKPCRRFPYQPNKRRFCSRTCWRAGNVGANHDGWKGGTGWYKTQRKAACERCGATKKLVVHHRDENRQNNTPSNLETLCHRCHQTHHRCWERLPRSGPPGSALIPAWRRHQLKLQAAPGCATREQVRARIAYYGGLCWICRKAPYTEMDHVIPISRGGSKWPANLRPVCRRCNSRKSDH